MRAASSSRELASSPSRPNCLRIRHHSARVREICPASSTQALVVRIGTIVAPLTSRHDPSFWRRDTNHARCRTRSYMRSRLIPRRNSKAEPAMLSGDTSSSSALSTTLDVLSSPISGRTTSVVMWSSSLLGIVSGSQCASNSSLPRARGNLKGAARFKWSNKLGHISLGPSCDSSRLRRSGSLHNTS